MFLGFEFISLVFLLIYAGAIAMLFLFVVMMLDLKLITDKKEYSVFRYLLCTATLFFSFFYDLLLINNKFYFNDWFLIFQYKQDILNLGGSIFMGYYLELVIISIILMNALVYSMLIVLGKKKAFKSQQLFEQIESNSSSLVYNKNI
jgi:NADH-quinone oxidoreductase subunit J